MHLVIAPRGQHFERLRKLPPDDLRSRVSRDQFGGAIPEHYPFFPVQQPQPLRIHVQRGFHQLHTIRHAAHLSRLSAEGSLNLIVISDGLRAGNKSSVPHPRGFFLSRGWDTANANVPIFPSTVYRSTAPSRPFPRCSCAAAVR